MKKITHLPWHLEAYSSFSVRMYSDIFLKAAEFNTKLLSSLGLLNFYYNHKTGVVYSQKSLSIKFCVLTFLHTLIVSIVYFNFFRYVRQNHTDRSTFSFCYVLCLSAGATNAFGWLLVFREKEIILLITLTLRYAKIFQGTALAAIAIKYYSI